MSDLVRRMRARPELRAERAAAAASQRAHSRLRWLWRNYNLSIVLIALFLTSWIMQTWMGWRQYEAEQHERGAVAQWLGDGGYLWRWGEATFENWQSEFLQLLTFVVLTTYLVHRGSHESKDTDEAMQRQLDRIEQRLAEREG